ncbi:hypothetical protein JJD41_23035 [Oxynema sp. CENA135]|uniref:hypothetical protein n=1 Tax=Oxynema sp. CENA135 TaxID=984206 RepID=UPI00190A0E08|nr:hypothetical protein [Oxynema sp. CENA135]MBK4732718.1 hypothetical protein [Oxynema sp. CENA135]
MTQYTLAWTGESGFSADGSFVVSPNFNGTIATKDNLEAFVLFLRDPEGNILSSFNYQFPQPPDSEFNFNFDTTTGRILQEGNFDRPDGFDLGIEYNVDTGLDFITYINPEEGVPETDIFLERIVTPGTDEGLIEIDEGGTLIASLAQKTYDLFWRGNEGYLAIGQFSYPEGREGIVTADDLSDLQLSLYDPDGQLLRGFDYDFPQPPSSELNFNFDTTTGRILQEGNFDRPDGFDLGIEYNVDTGLDFVTYINPEEGVPETDIFLDRIVTPGTDEGLIEIDEGGTLAAVSRQVDPLTGLDLADLFDEDFYLANNPDVAAAVAEGTFANGFAHFQANGQFEGRDPSAVFDTAFYLANNADVASGVAEGWLPSAVSHFVIYGEFERRSPNANYSEIAYLARNSEALSAVLSGDYATGIEHFLAVGRGLGLSAAPGFGNAVV